MIDLLVGSGLLTLLAPALLLVLTVTSTTFGAVAARAQAQAAARELLDAVGQDIRSARPIGWCPSAPPAERYTTPAPSCAHVADYTGWPPGAPVPGGPIVYADGQQLWFWDSTEVGSPAPLAVPDCVDVHVTPTGEVVIDRFGSTGTFTNAAWPAVAFPSDGTAPHANQPPRTSRRVGSLSPGASHDIFTTTDGQGGIPQTAASIVLLTIAPLFSTTVGRATVTFPVTVEAAVRGAVYNEEQAWNATV